MVLSSSRLLWRRMLSICAVGVLMPVATRASEEKIQFNRDVQPILSENCFACHGFDAKRRKAHLRLDTVEGSLTPNEDRVPVKPGNPAQSEVWLRITKPESDDDLMPPADSHKKLTAAQKETLRKWIEQGAPYQKHWAFEPPVKPPVPEEKGASNPLDAFLLQRLQKEGLSFSAEADRPTLIRRVSFALTGLPPTLAETDAFVSDSSPRAYEKVVEHYLESPHFGEEMACHWLDLARYADTHGLHLDNERSMWAYRDWVVKAFNENLPFDQFTIWQLAGDLLPQPTADQVTATGFNRCNVTTSEGGAIAEEFLYRYAVDRTATVATTWMGLTGGCAVCHDHKYDPITTKEFYSLYSFFYSAADPGMDKNIALTEPYKKLPQRDQQAALDAATRAEEAALKELEATAQHTPYADPADETSAPKSKVVTQVLFDDDFIEGAALKNTSRNPSAWVANPSFGAKSGRRVLRQESSHFHEDSITAGSVPVVVPAHGRFQIWVRPDDQNPPEGIAVTINAGGNHRLVLGKDRVNGEGVASNQPGKISVPLPTPGQWTQLTFTVEELGLTPGQRISMLTVEESGGVVYWDGFTLTGELNPATDPRASFMAWWKSATPAGKKQPEADLPGDLKAVFNRGPGKPASADERHRLLEFYLVHVLRPETGELAQSRTKWETARVTRAIDDDAIAATMVFNDLDTPRPAFVMVRGQYDKPADAVEPSTPAFLPVLKKAHPEGRATRLDLAKWLVSREHPLTARVTVNRLWQQFFGIGLVKTSHDFGAQGEPPTHPELLDWLAVHFEDSGWNVKDLVRHMVTSAAFRQDSRLTPALLQHDPENRLYARGPRFRLDAEQIRDNALFVSGLLDMTAGGRGIRTYQPPNIWEPVGYADSNTRYYLQDHGSALYRRSLYCFLKRTAPPPFMSNFDGPNREQSCTRRERSDTPLQALQLMNDVQHFEAARVLAERILQEGGTDDASRLTWLCRVVLARAPDARDLAILSNALAAQRQLYQADPQNAEKVLHDGESIAKHVAPAPEIAAWAMTANLVLNMDETLNRN